MDAIIEFLNQLSNPILAAVGIYVARSISELNTRIAVIIERVDSHERRITKLEG